jgi:hypothetical protein
MEVIKNQLESSSDVKVDTKMSTLKPLICQWLFTAWHHLTTKLEMVEKGWKHIGLLKAFEPEFQKQAMVDNIKTPLFKSIEGDIAMETNNTNEDEETCGEVSLDTILEESLTKVQLLTSKNKTPSMTSLRGIARTPTSATINTIR